MEETFYFVDDLQLLRDKMRRFQDVIISALEETKLCLQFVQEYCQQGFGGTFIFHQHSTRILMLMHNRSNYAGHTV